MCGGVDVHAKCLIKTELQVHYKTDSYLSKHSKKSDYRCSENFSLFSFSAYKPANANLQSTVFNLQQKSERKERKHYATETHFKRNIFDLPADLRVRNKPQHKNQISSVFSNGDVAQIKTECRRRPLSAIPFSDGCLSSQAESCDTSLWSADKHMAKLSGCMKHIQKPAEPSLIFSESEHVEKASVPIYSADGKVSKCKPERALTLNARRMQESSIFQESLDDCNFLWSSDFVLASRAVTRKATPNDTYKSHIFEEEWTPSREIPNTNQSEDVGEAVAQETKQMPSTVGSISTALSKSVILGNNAVDNSTSDSEIPQ